MVQNRALTGPVMLWACEENEGKGARLCMSREERSSHRVVNEWSGVARSLAHTHTERRISQVSAGRAFLPAPPTHSLTRARSPQGGEQLHSQNLCTNNLTDPPTTSNLPNPDAPLHLLTYTHLQINKKADLHKGTFARQSWRQIMCHSLG